MSAGKAVKSAAPPQADDVYLSNKGIPVVLGLSAAEKLHEASAKLRQAQTDLEKLKAQYSPDHAAWAQCEVIDDHLFEALRLLGQ